MKKVLLTFLMLGLLGGVASADHFRGGRGGGWGHSGGRVTWGGGASGGVRVHNAPVRVYSPRVYNNSYRVVRRPIFVQRPVMRYRYYNYYQRPAIIVENYPARDGYYWVAGAWSWTGYEWTWTPGHYEPDPNWVQPGYNYDYNYDYNNGTSVNVNVGSPGYDYNYQYQSGY